MDQNTITKRYEQATEASKRLKQVIEQLSRFSDVPEPADVRADALFWTGKGGATAHVVTQADQTNFLILGPQAHPGYVHAVDSNARLDGDSIKPFVQALQQWGIRGAGQDDQGQGQNKANR